MIYNENMNFLKRIETEWRAQIFGQSRFIEAVLPRLRKWLYYGIPQSQRGVPLGVFVLAGPTGSGKTRSVQALAQALHGSEKNVLTINCGEYQMEHEVAKLIGAPPGYLGHRETQPVITQMRINSVCSQQANVAVILFDEFEKAAPSLQRLLLGILGGTGLQLGDTTRVQFERCLIFLTTNIGAAQMEGDRIGYGGRKRRGSYSIDWGEILRRRTSPEFVGRITEIIPYETPTREAARRILEMTATEIKRDTIAASRHLADTQTLYDADILFTEGALEELLNSLTTNSSGARALLRAVADLLTEAYIDWYERRMTNGEELRNQFPPKIDRREVRKLLALNQGLKKGRYLTAGA